MALHSFFRCDLCGSDHPVAHPAGFRLKGEFHNPGVQLVPRKFDLYLCSSGCAAQYFDSFHQDILRRNESIATPKEK